MLWDRNEILSLDFKVLGLNDGGVNLGVYGLLQKLIPQLPTLENLLNIFISVRGDLTEFSVRGTVKQFLLLRCKLYALNIASVLSLGIGCLKRFSLLRM